MEEEESSQGEEQEGERKKKEQTEEMIRTGEKKSMTQPRLGRWARGEGGFKINEGGKEREKARRGAKGYKKGFR